VDNAHRVLCAIELVDKGPLRDADRIARRLGADLTVLHVIPDGYPGVPMSPAGLAKTLLDQQELSRKIGDHLSEQVGAQTGRSGDEIAIEVEAGVPHELIVQRARARFART
jgi:nucleotide-binding universal stress UspA family protein